MDDAYGDYLAKFERRDCDGAGVGVIGVRGHSRWTDSNEIEGRGMEVTTERKIQIENRKWQTETT